MDTTTDAAADRAQAGDGQAPATPSEAAPPWERSGEPFDPERAWNRIQSMKADLDAARAERDGYKATIDEAERAKLTETERLTADLDTLRTSNADLAAENALLRAVLDNPALTAADIELLQGIPADAVADRAAKLAARLGTGAPTTSPLARHAGLQSGADPTASRDASTDWLRAALARAQD